MPKESIEAYKNSVGWKSFKQINGIGVLSAVNIDGICYSTVGEGIDSVEVVSNPEKYSGDIAIPASVTYDGRSYTVASIGVDAFYECSGLKSVTIPNSVTSIGDEAFRDCTGLTSISIPNSVTSIGGGAFKDCTGLTSISIPNSVTSIGGDAFRDCTGLTKVRMEDGNKSLDLGYSIFYGCNVRELYLGRVLTTTEYSPSFGSTLTDVSISNSVTSIGRAAFSGCTGLTSMTIPNSVTSIGGLAFFGCSGLTSVTIPNSVTSIDMSAFKNCTGLTSVVIGNGVKIIEYDAFEGCTNLTSVSLGAGLRQIKEGVFFDCSNLTKITCHSSIPPYAVFESFNIDTYGRADVYGPEGNVNDYKKDNIWKRFLKIHGTDFSGVEDIVVDGASDGTSNGEPQIYDLQGRKLQEPVRGQVNIIDGKKVFVEK